MVLTKKQFSYLRWGGVTFVLLLICLYSAIQFFSGSIRTKIEEILNEKLTAHIHFETFQFSILNSSLSPTITVSDNTLIGLDEFHNDTLLTCSEITIRFPWSILWREETLIKEIELLEPHIFLHILKNGHNNFNILRPSTDSDSSSDRVRVDALLIKRGVLDYKDYQNDIFIHADQIDHSGIIRISADTIFYSTASSISKLNIEHHDILLVDNKTVTLKVDHILLPHSNQFRFIGHELNINALNLSFNGEIQNKSKGIFVNLVAKSKSTEFKQLLSLIPGAYRMDEIPMESGGTVSLFASIEGMIGDNDKTIPIFDIDMAISNGYFKIDSLPFRVDSINTQIEISNINGHPDSTTFHLKNLMAVVDKHQLKGNILVKGGKDKFIDMSLVGDFNLDAYTKIFPLSYKEIAGEMHLDVAAKGHLKYKKNHDSTYTLLQVPIFKMSSGIKNGFLNYDTLPLQFDKIQFQLFAGNPSGKPEDTYFQIPHYNIVFGKNTLEGKLLYKGYRQPFIDGNLLCDVNLDDIEKVYPIPKNQWKGKLKSQLEVYGSFNTQTKQFPKLTSIIQITDGYYKPNNYSESIENIVFKGQAINGTGKWEDTRIEIDQFTGSLANAPFTLSGYVNDLDRIEYSLKLKSTLDLEAFTKVNPIEGYKVRGSLQTNIESKGIWEEIKNKNYSNLTTNGSIEIKNGLLLGSAWAKTIQIGEGLWSFQDEAVKVEKCKLKIDHSDIAIKGYLNHYLTLFQTNSHVNGDFVLSGDTLDLNPLLSSSRTANASGTWKVPSNWALQLSAKFKHVYFTDLHFSPLHVNATIENKTVRLNECKTLLNNSIVMGNGTYTTTEKTPFVTLKLNVTHWDIQKGYQSSILIRNWLPASKDAYGIVDIDYMVKGKLGDDYIPITESLQGEGTVTIQDATINGMKMFEELSKHSKEDKLKAPNCKSFTLFSTIKNNTVYIPNFQCKINGFETEIEGKAEFTGPIQFVIKMQLLPMDVIKIPFHVSGTYDNPKVIPGKGKNSDSSVNQP
ncbi:MAG: AsmA-like C-terminal region-containing protein [Cytophagaceae bacterium]|jgi:hypothetical protein|nr:AsmA-like C-terminal region-containing protein [Cytophagaceae bacterium]